MPNPLPENELPPVPEGYVAKQYGGDWELQWLEDGVLVETLRHEYAKAARQIASWLDKANGVDVPKSIEWLTIIPALGLDPERSHSTEDVLVHIAQLQDAAKIGRAAVSNAMDDDSFGLLRDLIGAARCVGAGALARIAAIVRRGLREKSSD